jgi:hypothetical protein
MDPILSHFSLVAVLMAYSSKIYFNAVLSSRAVYQAVFFPNKSFVCISCFATNAASPHYTGLQNESQNATVLEYLICNWILFYFTFVVAVSFC